MRLKALEKDNRRLKQIVAEQVPDIRILKEPQKTLLYYWWNRGEFKLRL